MPRKAPYKPNHHAVVYSRDVLVNISNPDVAPDGTHTCLMLEYTNENREKAGDVKVAIFEDLESCMWNMRLGLEFVEIYYCPFCGKLPC